jgi:tripartite-type tricarboxylate transporter receptor subunit TctC
MKRLAGRAAGWAALGAVAAALLSAGASAQTFPSKPLRLVVGFPPGGVPDIVARVVAEPLAQRLGQPVVVENRAGAAGTVATEAVARSPADGYTLLLGTTGTLASAPSLYPSLGYDPLKSFAPISLVASAPFVIVVGAAAPPRSLTELIALAKSRPGQLHFGSVGNGSPPHIAGEMFKAASGVDLVHVPYKGLPTAVGDLLSGRIEVMFNQVAPFLPHIQAGKLRVLAVAGPSRVVQISDVPTAAEAGLPGYEVSIWSGLLAPAGTPQGVVARLNDEIGKVLATRAVQEGLASQGFQAAGSSPERFAALVASETTKWSRAIQLSGAKAD